jgi:hypothetical protein
MGNPFFQFPENIFRYNNSIIHHQPVASTIPRSVRILIENPETYMIKKVATNEIGISINGRMQ